MEPNAPECPICFVPYDNAFKTPLLLPCAHTFCLECLSKLCVFQRESDTFFCPLCRAPITIPPGGVPKLPPNMSLVSHFPPWMRQLQEVWLEGSKLCWRKGGSYVTATPNSVSQFPLGPQENMIVTIYLLGPAAPHFSHPGDLVTIPQPPPHRRCGFFLRNYGCVLWVFICCIILLFIMIFFPTYMRF
ncbi:RING finger protein 223-like [Xenopus tropicalis]|uniref:RING finger protein 223-like n=1 Tax=Xenopus tropicalis TaxID=8364 RepID=A0A8J1IQ89_XENTR|nr:RING finger protein 223-like [Xenopus tropicalis]